MDIDILYQALANAETGREENPWIRTKYKSPGGSSAFGPVQITKGLLEGSLKNNTLSPQMQVFTKDIMLPMQQQFLKYGAQTGLTPEQQLYNYGGTGGFDESNKDAYTVLAKELIQDTVNRSMGKNGVFNSDKFLKLWRGAKPEKDYASRFYEIYKKPSQYKQ